MTTLSGIKARAYNWLWEPWFPYGEVTVLVGGPGSGKGTLLAWSAGNVTQNGFDVILVSPEDRVDTTLVPRYRAVNAVMDRVHDLSYVDDLDTATAHSFQLGGDASDLPALEAKLRESSGRVKLVILDGLNATAGVTLNTQRSVRRKIMEPLQDMAWKYQCAIVLVHHFNKSGQVAGSTAVVEAARQVLEVKVNGPVRQLSIRKSNIIDKDVAPIYYSIDGQAPFASLRWVNEAEVQALLHPQCQYQPPESESFGSFLLGLLSRRSR